MEFVKVQKAEDWNQLISGLPNAHVLQSWQWGQAKAPLGWRPFPYVWRSAGGSGSVSDSVNIRAAALIMQRKVSLPAVPFHLSMLYIPRGPLLDWSDSRLVQGVLDDIQGFARQQRTVFLKIDPDVCVATGIPGSQDDTPSAAGQSLVAGLEKRGWHFSDDQVQFRNTVMIDLTAPEAEMLTRMRQKTRYNVRLAERKGVAIRTGGLDDLPLLYKMYAETSVRDGFVIRDSSYYLNIWESFLKDQMAEVLVADSEGEAVAGVIIFRFYQRAWYLYGMSRDLHRDKMPNYLLQWEAMRRAKAAGCLTYDLWGAPDDFNETDSMWGVFKFKEGLGGYVVRTPGAWDYPVQPWLYTLYTKTFPRLLDLMRRRGKARTRQEVAAL